MHSLLVIIRHLFPRGHCWHVDLTVDDSGATGLPFEDRDEMGKVVTGFRAYCRLSAMPHNVTAPLQLCILDCPTGPVACIHGEVSFTVTHRARTSQRAFLHNPAMLILPSSKTSRGNHCAERCRPFLCAPRVPREL